MSLVLRYGTWLLMKKYKYNTKPERSVEYKIYQFI